MKFLPSLYKFSIVVVIVIFLGISSVLTNVIFVLIFEPIILGVNILSLFGE
jgi:hypothetical protein